MLTVGRSWKTSRIKHAKSVDKFKPISRAKVGSREIRDDPASQRRDDALKTVSDIVVRSTLMHPAHYGFFDDSEIHLLTCLLVTSVSGILSASEKVYGEKSRKAAWQRRTP